MRYLLFIIAFVACLTGCQKPVESKSTVEATKPKSDVPDDVSAERGKLSAEDRTLVEAQEWCVVSNEERLGSMGPPLKLDIKGQAAFVCCKACKRRAEADPEKTLAKLAELKSKKASLKS